MIESPIETHSELGQQLGVHLLVKRDDLLPFPLAGNKVRKLQAEIQAAPAGANAYITNGAISSNHCRTLAFMAASLGRRAHMVLHGDVGLATSAASLRMYSALGATFDVDTPSTIASRLTSASKGLHEAGFRPHLIAGGCHTAAGVESYSAAARLVMDEHPEIEVIVVASGTGATQAGIVCGVSDSSAKGIRVVGISVGRKAVAGKAAVLEAIKWVMPDKTLPVEFYDEFLAGGYGKSDSETQRAVGQAWRNGLPLDTTYTGKAFNGLTKLVASGNVSRSAIVLFWHTGGLWNQLQDWNSGPLLQGHMIGEAGVTSDQLWSP